MRLVGRHAALRGARRFARDTALSPLPRAAFAQALVLLAGALLGLGRARAAATAPALKHALSAQVFFNDTATTGTSNTRTLDTNDHVRYKLGLWRYAGRLSYDYAASLGLVSANRLALNLKASHYFSGEKENFLLATLSYVRNPFDGYRHYEVESVGAGHRFLRHGRMRFTVDAGAGLRQNTYFTGAHNDVPVLRVAADYHWRFSKKSIFSQRLAVLGATTGTLLTSSTGLTAPISAKFALKLSEVVDHYTSAPAGFKPTSTFTTLNLIYNFP